MFGWAKNLFSSSDESSEKTYDETLQFYSPLRIGLHSTLIVDAVDFLTLVDTCHPQFTPPTGQLDVIAIGVIDNDPDDIFRIYVSDQNNHTYCIQLLCCFNSRSGEKEITEVLFTQRIHEEVPLLQEQWDAVPDRLGAQTIGAPMYASINYDRVWGDDVDGVIDLFIFREKVIDMQGVNTFDNHQMLFGRTIDNAGTDLQELMLIGVEEDTDNDKIVTNIGFNISAHSVHVQ
jgi:hypothetical protein